MNKTKQKIIIMGLVIAGIATLKFCAGFAATSGEGELGGNKEGDEPQVKEGEMPHCSSLYVPPEPEPEIELPPGVPPGNKCAVRVLKALADGTKFDIVRPTGEDIKSRFPETRSGWHGASPCNFCCNDVCARRGQDCLGVGLYGVKNTFCRYIIHNHGNDCQISANLDWGECEMGFRYGGGFCYEFSPVYASWGYTDTGCYCVDKGYLPN